MIWYLLYPLRGTTDPPRLSTSHPIRRAFQAHGTATARHWLLSILVTIAISVLLCYQAVFQADSSAASGLRNLPKHVWTSTTRIEGDRPADVVVRQVWVHGNYMMAINQSVLREAMYVQDMLIADGFGDGRNTYAHQQVVPGKDQGCVKAASGQRWGWHSPLMYWNCSSSTLEAVPDPLSTINACSECHSDLNITLRPSTVFAGKIFSRSKLRAADALVITLFDYTGSNLFGEEWNVRSRKLASHLSPDWIIIPHDGQVRRSRLYEFRFSPMTLSDNLVLTASYVVTVAYVIWKMMQLRAVKSWLGLLATICAKMSICIIASFTVCTYLGVDLTCIPRPCFPAVVFCFGLGNIFRLINVVLETPPELPPHQRIGNALGEVGHLSLAIAFQNLALIYLCSRIVTPWVADFCVFAAVTLVFDLVFHLTFFVAVLSVDVQRLELSDSLERIEICQAAKKLRQERPSWFAAVREGKCPLSTRFAGTGAILGVIVAINWHFFDPNDQPFSFRGRVQRILSGGKHLPLLHTMDDPPINQARTPADWLKIQDHNTARELFAFIKPDARTFIARIYDPLLIVSSGASGRDRRPASKSMIETFHRFSQKHAFPAALIVVTIIAGVTLLMNYLLWSGLPDETADDEALFSVTTLTDARSLDVVQLDSCLKGHLAAVSLDKSTTLWLHEQGSYAQVNLKTATMKPKLWPIYASAIDVRGTLLALCTDTGQIGLWNIPKSKFLMFPKVDIRGHRPLLFSFTTLITRTDHEKLCIMIMSHDGYLIELEAGTGIHKSSRVSPTAIAHATIYSSRQGNSSLLFVTKLGAVYTMTFKDSGFSTPNLLTIIDTEPQLDNIYTRVSYIQCVPGIGMLFALRDECAHVIDFKSRALIHTFQIGHVKPHTFRVMHSVRRTCACGAPAVHPLSFAYTEQNSDHLIMQTFTLGESSTSLICLGRPQDRIKQGCKGLDHTKEAVHYVDPAGVWESTSVLSVVGIRQCSQISTPSSTASDDGRSTGVSPFALDSALKQRAKKQNVSSGIFQSLANRRSSTCINESGWEAWTLSSSGEFSSRPLSPDDLEDTTQANPDDDLFVAAPGPITRLGKRSVAVGFGNTVKIITIGKESFEGLTFGNGAMDIGVVGGSAYSTRSKRGGRRI